MTITAMTLSELEDHGRITEILCIVRVIEKRLYLIERRLKTLSNDQPKMGKAKDDR